jgi:hypothetical protein
MPIGNVSAAAGAQAASLTSARPTTNTAQSQAGQEAAQKSAPKESAETVDHSIPSSTGNNVDLTA